LAVHVPVTCKDPVTDTEGQLGPEPMSIKSNCPVTLRHPEATLQVPTRSPPQELALEVVLVQVLPAEAPPLPLALPPAPLPAAPLPAPPELAPPAPVFPPAPPEAPDPPEPLPPLPPLGEDFEEQVPATTAQDSAALRKASWERPCGRGMKLLLL
jgi:hypothetical protein